jgi:hypothetical protein
LETKILIVWLFPDIFHPKLKYSVDGSQDGSPVRFGQAFALSTTDGKVKQLLI